MLSGATKNPILVTGADGYLASFLINLLLRKDFQVRGTVLSLADTSSYNFLYDMVPEKKDNLELIEANLSEQDIWKTATQGVQSIFHIASPTPSATAPRTDEHFVKPAVSGVLSILEAAVANGVKKVVYTSSSSAIAFEKNPKLLTEEDWQAEEGLTSIYAKSKIRAEKAVWDFYEKNKGKIEIAVVNPSFVFGPLLSTRASTSGFVGNIMQGALPGIFDATIPVVDVRDVAEVHYRAMFRENANGQRYICMGESVPLGDIAHWINKEFGNKGIKISEEKMSLGEIMKSGKPEAQMLGYVFGSSLRYDNQKSVKDLEMNYLPVEKTIIDTGNDLIKFGLVKVVENNS